MIRLHILTEGRTEERFACEVLVPHLANFEIFADAKSILTGRDKKCGKTHKGGLVTFGKFRREMSAWMKEDKDPQCRFTTMFDFYALPTDFPAYEIAAGQRNPYERIQIIERGIAGELNDARFIPYIQLHEFEALILADPRKLELIYLAFQEGIANLEALASAQNPELIDEGRETAPSKRILHEIPIYKKSVAGPEIGRQIGIPVLRQRCPHFGQWLTRLEQLARDSGNVIPDLRAF